MSRCIFVISALVLMAATSSYCMNVLKVLPENRVSPMQQCRDRKLGYFVGVCQPENPADMCESLKCGSNRGDIPDAEDIGKAFAGTWCGPKKMCFMGSCIEDTKERENPFDKEEGLACME
ncbi:uncharacterized protein [Venturia canescens]|uniref:uncharacterized protein n=1 Tax=Venturia canescens TaxID=32260 RepID=UPI001C9D0FDE|nr:uncharacterized protein LOC122411172 [Venturia canescens]